MAKFNLYIVTVATIFITVFANGSNATFLGRSRTPSPTRQPQCQPCPVVIHPTHQCQIPTTCTHGRCLMELNRCTAEYLNAHGSSIDLSLWNTNNNNQQRQDSDNHSFEPIELDDFTVDPHSGTVTLSRSGQKIEVSQETANRLLNQRNSISAQTNSIDEFTDSDDIEEVVQINTSAAPPLPNRSFHVHVGCMKCGQPILCANDDNCNDLEPGAFCVKQRGQLYGKCMIEKVNGRTHKSTWACCVS